MLSCFSCVCLFAIQWTVALRAPLSMGFSRQEYWSGLLFPSLGDLPAPGIDPGSSTLHFYSSKKLFSFLPLSCAHTVASSRIAHFSGCFYPLYVHLNLIFFFFLNLLRPSPPIRICMGSGTDCVFLTSGSQTLGTALPLVNSLSIG